LFHTNLTNNGFRSKGRTAGGNVEYKHPDGRTVWIRPNGEVITIRKEWAPCGTRKMPVRYQWDGTPVPGGGHSTGEFVEPIGNASFLPSVK
jgi:hypothetical protein